MKRPSPALVIAVLALVVALGGTSVAAFKLQKNSVGSKQVKKDSLTGDDVNESTFGKVPSAGSADKAADALHAATADNADTLVGETGPFVLGAGAQFALADELTTTPGSDAQGILFPSGDLILTCSATPDLTWENDHNDTGTPPTDIWTGNGGHTAVTDAAALTPLDSNMSDGTQDVEIWPGDDTVISVRVSAFWDTANCQMAMFANIEPNGAGLAGGGTRERSAEPPRALAPVGDK